MCSCFTFCLFIHFHARFPLVRVVEAAVLGGPQIPHGQQLIVLATQQGGTRPSRRCNHATWFMVGHWTSFHRVCPTGPNSPIFRVTFWINGRTNVAGISRFREVAFRVYEFHSCLPPSVTPWTLRRNYISDGCTWDSILSTISREP